MVPWLIVAVIDQIAWWFGFQVYASAVGGPGWHRGRIGADSIHFVRCAPGAKRLPKLRRRARENGQ